MTYWVDVDVVVGTRARTNLVRFIDFKGELASLAHQIIVIPILFTEFSLLVLGRQLLFQVCDTAGNVEPGIEMSYLMGYQIDQ